MKPIIKLYVKTFLLTGIPYGLLNSIIDWANRDEFSLKKFIFMTLSFGIVMSLILVTYHIYLLKKKGIEDMTDLNLGLYKIKRLKSVFNTTEMIEKLKSNTATAKMKMTEVENGIKLKTGMSWKSWGEEIKIILKSNNDSEFEYQVSSSPRLKITLVDYGKNLENVHLIEKVIT